MNASMSVGVACAVALSMTRVLTGSVFTGLLFRDMLWRLF